jgi:putative membrane protein
VTAADVLPHLNAILNATASVLLVTGWVLIKSRRIAQHRACMIAAVVTSSLFLTSYVIYHAQVGSKPFPGTGWIRAVYFSILIPHVLLAALTLPFILVTFVRGLRRDDTRHRRVARWTMPLWLFVSVSGVVVYLMLYHGAGS